MNYQFFNSEYKLVTKLVLYDITRGTILEFSSTTSGIFVVYSLFDESGSSKILKQALSLKSVL